MVGESGSGKTTLARLLLMLIKPDGGEISLSAARAVGGMKSSEFRAFRLAVQPIFQDSKRRISIRAATYATRSPRRCARPRCQSRSSTGALSMSSAVCASRHPTIFLRRYPHELSGGPAPAARHCTGPSRCLPSWWSRTSRYRERMHRFRGQILKPHAGPPARNGHMAYLLITHDISIARAMAHRTMVMYRGTIVEEGQTSEILDSPQHPLHEAAARRRFPPSIGISISLRQR